MPAIDRWLDTQPKPFVIAEVPVPSPGDLGALERQQTPVDAARDRALAEDHSRLQRHQAARFTSSSIWNCRLSRMRPAWRVSASVGVNSLVVHTDDYGSRWASVEEQIAHTPALKLEHVEGAGRVYSLLPP